MRTTLRFAVLLLAWLTLLRTDIWAQTCPGSAPGGINYTTTTEVGTRQGTGTAGTVGSANTITDASGTTGTTVTFNNYQKLGAAGNTNVFAVGTNGALAGQSLVWQTNYNSGGFLQPAADLLSDNQSSVTLTFSRAVSGLTLRLQDLDLGTNFRDNVTFNGYTTVTATGTPSGTPVTLASSNFTVGSANQYVGGTSPNTVQGTGTSDPGTVTAANGNLTVSFSQNIRAVTIIYRNTQAIASGTDRTQTLGINSVSWCRIAPVANNVTNSVTLPTSVGQANIDALSSTVDGTLQSYTITAIPAATQGVLYYNTTASTYEPVTNNLVLTPAQAASLRFEPANGGTASSASFSYRATDDANLLSANTATFTIPLRVLAPCVSTSSLSFNTPRPTGQDWRARTAESVPSGSPLTQVTTSNYTIGTTDANSLVTNGFNGIQTLLWNADYATGSNKTATVTFNFTRPVSNFRVQVQDIDNGTDYIDRVTFAGSNAGTGVTPSLSKVNSNSTFVAVSGTSATGTGNTTSATDATVIAYFPDPITSLTLTYQNVSTTTNGASAFIGIDFMDWCRLAPVANNITNTSVSNAAGTAPVNGFSSVVDGTTTYVLTAIPTPTQGILYVNGVAATVGQTLTPAQAAQLSFDPADTFSGTVSFNYSVRDDAGQTASATYTIPVNASGAAGTVANCATPGRDGSPLALSTNPNTYYPSTGTQLVQVGATRIIVGPALTGANTSASDIRDGDLLLVIQMQGADIDATNTSAYGSGLTTGNANGNLLNANFTAGQYEYVVARIESGTTPVTALAGGTIVLSTPLRNAYQNDAASSTTGQRRFQVIRVPQYGNLTLGASLSPAAWNGNAGGIIVLDVAKQLNLNGNTINASGAGFRGGAGRILGGTTGLLPTDYRTATSNASKGEGTAGTPRYVNSGTAVLDNNVSGYPNGDNGRGAPGNAGGGGTDGNPTANNQNTGGGGGGNGGSGGRGGNSWATNQAVGGEPGAAFAVASSSRLVLGGGGGAGVANDTNPAYASSGSAGGGIVIVRTGTVSGNGSIISNGADAPSGTLNEGAGGGGAGGSILITANTPASLNGLTLTANGGRGGNNAPGADPHGPGGGGGGGVVLTNGAVQASNVIAGVNGVTNSTNNPGAFGAEPGLVGATNAQISNNIANSTAGANCPADVTTTITGPTTITTNQAAGPYSVTFTNNGTSNASNVTQLVTLPAGATVTAAQLPAGATFTTVGTVTTINFGTVATLASGAGNTYAFNYTAPPTNGSYSLVSNVATDASQGANTATDVATLTIQVNGAPANCQPSYLNNTTVSSGLTAEYYAGYFNDDISYFQRAAPIRRLDPTVDFSTGDGNTTWGNLTGVAGGVATNYDTFSSRYRGSIYITTAGTYTFYLGSDDASYLWLDGAALAPATTNATISNGGQHSYGTLQATVTLSAGPHNIAVVYGENFGGNSLKLEYENTALGIARQVIPSSLFCAGPATTNVPPVAQNVTNVPLLGSAGATVLNPNLSGSDTDGTVSYFNILTLPSAASGILTYNNTAVVVGQAIPVGALNLLRFVPSTSFNGNATFTYSVTDNNGRTDTNGITGAAATYTIPVNSAADVTTTVAGPATLNPGQPSGNYTAAFTNNGPNPASTVTRQVTLPAGATNVFVNGVAYTLPANNIIDFGTAATLASGATNLFTFSFTAPTTPGNVAIISNVTTTTTQGADTAPNSATLNATIGSPANVAATISPATGMATVTAGQPASFNVSFSNSGPATAAGVVATVQLPAGLGVVTASNGGVYDNATGIVTYAGITSYNSGGSTASVISFTAPASGPVTATASIRTTTSEAGQTANNTQSASIGVTQAYDVTTSITGPATTAVGVQTTFSVMTINNGPSVAPSVVQTVTGLPTNLTNVYVSNGGTYNAANGTVTFPALATMANGARVDNTISFTPTTVNTTGFTATATATANGTNAGDSNTANNSVAAAALVVNAAPAASTNANIYTTITTPSASVAPGATTTFTVTSGNRGAATATAVAQQTTLPAGLSNVVVRDAANNVVPNTATTGYNSATGLVVVPAVGSVLSGTTTSYSISLTAPASGVVAAVATISSNNADSMPADNISTADVTVVPTTDVVVSLTGPTSIVAGNPATYTVTTTNNGPVTATNVATTVAIPVGLTGVTVSGGGTYSAATGVVTFPATTSLLNGASASNTITYMVPNIASISNVASVTSATSDSQPANNTATVTTAVKGIADLTVALSGPTTIVQGNQVDYVVAVTNNGPAAATNTVIKVQLPAGLSGVVLPTNGTYDTATGVVTFTTLANQPAGTNGSVSYGIRFIAPAGLTSLYAAATVGTDSEESSYTNNTANLTTAVLAPTTGQADLRIVVTPSTTTPVAGQQLTLSLSTTNLSTSTVTATNVVTRMSIEAGLPLSAVTVTNGGIYDPATGVITFPALSSLAIGASVANTVVITMPGATPFTTRGLVSGDQSDPTPGNNVDFRNLTVTQRADVATTISGPATAQPGDLVTYSVSTLNNGPSVATGVVQKVTIPAGVTGLVISGGGILSGNVVTFPTISNQVAGINGEVVNTISFNAPATFTTSYDVVANVTTTSTQPTTPGTTNDAATVTTSRGNRAPVANAVVNSLRTPEGNTASAMAISPLSGTDADGSGDILSYTITSIPNATTQGVLRLNGALVAAGTPVPVADIANLTFTPVNTFVGNAFFTYTVTDRANVVSAPATYTIPVGQDLSAAYTLTDPKGGATPYQNGDVIANVFDVNGGSYNSAATPEVTDTGIRTATLTTGTLPAGTTLDPVTGIITVTNRLLLVTGNYPVTVTTVDAYGGTNTSTFTIVIGTRPLPVELKTFEVRAVKADALLDWATASEKNNDHFDVERSLNGTTFEKIGTVRGQGTTQTATAYNFTDAGIGAKTQSLVYYRLRQVDADGTVNYSPVRTVRFEAQAQATAKLSVFPNPATASDRVVTLDLSTLPNGTYQAALFDAAGRILGAYSVEGGVNKTVDVQSLPTGTYIIQVSGNGLKLSVRLLKE